MHAADAVRAVPGVGDEGAGARAALSAHRVGARRSTPRSARRDGVSDDELRARGAARGSEKVDAMSRPKLLDELFGRWSRAQIDSRRSSSTIRWSCRRSRSRSAATPRSRSGSSCSRAGKELANAFSELNDPIDQRAALRGAGAPAGRGRRGGERGRRGLPARDGVRHAADGRRRHRHRPAVHVPHRHARTSAT